jgi:hypothetical protein
MDKYGITELKSRLMEGVSPGKIKQMPLLWCAQKYTALAVATTTELFMEEVYSDPGCTLGEYMYRLVTSLREDTGIDILSFNSLSDEDWKIIRRIAEERGEIVSERKPTPSSLVVEDSRPTLAWRILNKITFKPLHGNKFRCNQTGEIVRARQTRSYANRHAISPG